MAIVSCIKVPSDQHELVIRPLRINSRTQRPLEALRTSDSSASVPILRARLGLVRTFSAVPSLLLLIHPQCLVDSSKTL